MKLLQNKKKELQPPTFAFAGEEPTKIQLPNPEARASLHILLLEH